MSMTSEVKGSENKPSVTVTVAIIGAVATIIVALIGAVATIVSALIARVHPDLIDSLLRKAFPNLPLARNLSIEDNDNI